MIGTLEQLLEEMIDKEKNVGSFDMRFLKIHISCLQSFALHFCPTSRPV